MKLYYHPASYNSRRVLAVAYECGAELELQVCDILSGEQRSPAFLQLNPNGRVPVLADGAFTLWESAAIAQYLASTQRSSLLPESAQGLADVTRWQAWDLAHLGRAADVFLFENVVRGLFGLGAPQQAALDQAAGAWTAALAVLDSHLRGRPFVTGEQLTIADFTLAGSYASGKGCGAPVGTFADVERWFSNIEQRPSWQRAQMAGQAA